MQNRSTTDRCYAKKAIEEMVRRIVLKFDPEQIILFGSQARGTATSDSDVDLLVVLKSVDSRRAKRLELRKELRGVGVAKDVVVTTLEEVDEYRDVVGSLIRPALKEGIKLYDRSQQET